jgi:hypothetical protein
MISEESAMGEMEDEIERDYVDEQLRAEEKRVTDRLSGLLGVGAAETATNYVRLLLSMATDYLMGNGPTQRAFIQNLRTIADHMESILNNAPHT